MSISEKSQVASEATSGLGALASSHYLRFLDGIRGLAIILVILFHFTRGTELEGDISGFVVETFGAFFLGVDVFFLASGFLITRLLLKSETSVASVKAFFARRVLRLFPPYWLYLATCFFLLPMLGYDDSRDDIAENWVWYFTYTNNVLITFEGWPASYLSHLWSLAVEEQFYLFWPFLLAVPYLQRHWLASLLALAAIGPITRAAMTYGDFGGYGVYVLLPARLDAIVLGGLIVVCEARGHLKKLDLAFKTAAVPSAVYMAIYLYGIGRGDEIINADVNTVVRHLAVSLLTGALLTECLRNDGWMRKLFSYSILVKPGKLCYGLYLWHYFVNTWFLKEGLHPRGFMGNLEGWNEEYYLTKYLLVTSSLSYFIALVSWKFFEEPILALKKYFPSPPRCSDEKPSA